MEERELRSRANWVLGWLLAIAFVGTIVWSVAQDQEAGDRAERSSRFEDTGDAIDPSDAAPLVVAPGLDPDDFVTPTSELPRLQLTVHTDGCGVIRSEAPDVDLTWVVKDADGFQVLGRNANGETRYRYFQGGTYTVVLEAWSGSGYEEVSNTVTIHC